MGQVVSLALHRLHREFAATDPVKQSALYVFSEEAMATPPLSHERRGSWPFDEDIDTDIEAYIG
jgi:hypothetical protein